MSKYQTYQPSIDLRDVRDDYLKTIKLGFIMYEIYLNNFVGR